MNSKLKIGLSVAVIVVVSFLLIAYSLYDSIIGGFRENNSFDGSEFLNVEQSLQDTVVRIQEISKDSMISSYLDSVDRYYHHKYKGGFKGSKISILITGVDSRVGSSTKHADANHLVNLWFNEGKIEIISIPRGTPADAQLEDSVQNYLANVLACRGRKVYMEEIKRITGIQKIDYWVEFGFGQAMRLMELMGFKGNSDKMLRILRSRKSFRSGDHQRSYNQGQFIRQMILTTFPMVEGIKGDLMLRGALMVAESNLSYEKLADIIARLRSCGYGNSPDDVVLHVKPKYRHKYFEFNFTDINTRDSLHNYINNRFAQPQDTSGSKLLSSIKKLDDKINLAIRDSADNPNKTIRCLKRVFEQKAWYQIPDSALRSNYRNKICNLLINAYNKIGKNSDSKMVTDQLELDKQLDREF